jgi:hypothetical protein
MATTKLPLKQYQQILSLAVCATLNKVGINQIILRSVVPPQATKWANHDSLVHISGYQRIQYVVGNIVTHDINGEIIGIEVAPLKVGTFEPILFLYNKVHIKYIISKAWISKIYTHLSSFSGIFSILDQYLPLKTIPFEESEMLSGWNHSQLRIHAS